MSPSLPTARFVWVWSFPALAIILSFLWYRKKRGSLKTDSGGAGETQNDQMSVESEKEITVPEKSAEVESFLAESEESRREVIEVFDQIKLNATEAEGVLEAVGESDPATENNLPEIEEDKTEEDNGSGARTDPEIVKAIEELMFPPKAESIPAKSKCGKKKKFKDMAKKSSEAALDQRKNNEESAACILEQKLSKLDLTNQDTNDEIVVNGTSEDVAERDSANNSPSEVMLASPSVSGYSDTHSEVMQQRKAEVLAKDLRNGKPVAEPTRTYNEVRPERGSSDSGKGCSEMLTPSRTPASGNSVSGDLPVTSMYEFVIPQQLVGRLIGRHGSYVNEIKETTHASIYIKRHPDTPKLKICAVEGTQMDIESALESIRRKFPKKRYPNVTLEQVVISPEPQMIPIISEQMQLYLIEGINNDVILSSLVSAGHFFLQQPTHPTYLSLSRLNQCMMYCYSEPDQPTLPERVGAGVLCAAPVHNGWYRAQIISMDAENKLCDVKFVDYGGYMTMPVSALRQIRVDFVNLPFQASECYLAGVKPANEENVWCEKAKELVEKLTFGKVLQAQVYGYGEDSVPLIYLYTVVDNEVILINQELVDRGFAEWLYWEPVTEEVQEIEGSELEETGQVPVTVNYF